MLAYKEKQNTWYVVCILPTGQVHGKDTSGVDLNAKKDALEYEREFLYKTARLTRYAFLLSL